MHYNFSIYLAFIFSFLVVISEASQVTVSDIVLSSKKSVQHMYMQQDWKSVLEYFHRDTRYNPNRHYNIIREIGEGTFGHVYLAKHNEIQVLTS